MQHKKQHLIFNNIRFATGRETVPMNNNQHCTSARSQASDFCLNIKTLHGAKIIQMRKK